MQQRPAQLLKRKLLELQVRRPTSSELNATAVLALQLEEVSAKVRTSNQTEDEARDKSLPIWAGMHLGRIKFPLNQVLHPFGHIDEQTMLLCDPSWRSRQVCLSRRPAITAECGGHSHTRPGDA